MIWYSMTLRAPLSQEIQREYNRLTKLIASIPSSAKNLKKIDGTGEKVSLSDLIAYQIGWGRCVIRWYEAGLRAEIPEMPGEGFSTWDYRAIARHFYQKYQDEQDQTFHRIVMRLIEIVEKEFQTGNLEKIGVWNWCTLSSGKQWPLSKWIRVNTCAPYRRACTLIKKTYRKNSD